VTHTGEGGRGNNIAVFMQGCEDTSTRNDEQEPTHSVGVLHTAGLQVAETQACLVQFFQLRQKGMCLDCCVLTALPCTETVCRQNVHQWYVEQRYVHQ
jgi:hypothetical protein